VTSRSILDINIHPALNPTSELMEIHPGFVVFCRRDYRMQIRKSMDHHGGNACFAI